MAAVSLLFVLFALVLTVGGGLVLYRLVRTEHDRRTTTDRESAERLARRDTNGGSERTEDARDDEAVEGNHWG